MSRIRIVFACALLLTGLFWSGHEFLSGHFLGGMAFILAGVFAAWPAAAGFLVTWENPLWIAGTSLALLCSIATAFFETPGTDIERQSAQTALMAKFVEMATDPYQQYRLNATEKVLVERGVQACALQGNVDMIGTVVALKKTIELGPTATLADQALTNATGEAMHWECLDYYHLLRKFRPEAFLALEREHKGIIPAK